MSSCIAIPYDKCEQILGYGLFSSNGSLIKISLDHDKLVDAIKFYTNTDKVKIKELIVLINKE